MIKLEWTTEKKVVNDLIPLEINPRKISEDRKQKMIESIQKFNLVDIPVIDIDGTLISGHQRLKAMQIIGRGEEIIDVRMPNRKLTDKEIKEYNLLSNSHFGEFDFDILQSDFADIDFKQIGIDMPDMSLLFESIEEKKVVKKPEVKDLKPFELTHVLISFPPEKLMDIEHLLQEIKNNEFVEYEQSSN